MENAYVESFHGRFRDECLNQHHFLDLQEAKDIIETWRLEYNGLRPHSALNYQAPEEFLKQYRKQQQNQNNPELSLQVA